MSYLFILFVVLLVLKLAGVLAWSWLIVLLPLIIGCLIELGGRFGTFGNKP